MASLWQSIKNWWRGKRDDAADAISDPIRDAKFAIEDSEELVSNFESHIADLMAHSKRTALSINSAEHDVAKWDSIAKAAANSGNRPDCESAVKQKTEAQQKRDRLRTEFEQSEQVVAGLRKQLDAAKEKISHAKNNKEVLSARLKGAEIREQLSNASTAMKVGGPLAALSALEQKTIETETHADAVDDLHKVGSEDLAEKYSSASKDVQDEVERLMQKR